MPALYITEQGATLRHENGRLCIARGKHCPFSVPVVQVERVLVFGNVQVTTGALGLLLHEGIEISFLSSRGRLKGRVVPPGSKNLALRLAQYQRAHDGDFALKMAQVLVAGKIRNARTLLGRHARNYAPCRAAMLPLRREMAGAAKSALRATELPVLLGIEGRAAKVYFQGLGQMLKAPQMSFTGRTRHPPLDPVNALLSLGYTLAGNELWATCAALGLDPYLGFLHGLSERRPGLPMDLLEEFRAPLVDRFTLALLNRRVLDNNDFYQGERGGVFLHDFAMKRFLRAWEGELNREFKHPATGQPVCFRRLFLLQTQNMARAIEHDEVYQPYAFYKK